VTASAGGASGLDRTGLLLLLVAVVSVGAAAVLIRLAAAPALTTSFVRLAVGGVVLIASVVAGQARRAQRFPQTHRALQAHRDARDLDLPQSARGSPRATSATSLDLRRVVAAGVLLALHFALWIASLSRTTVAASVVLVCLQPVFVALLAWWLLGERTGRRALAGIAVAFSGAAVIAVDAAPAALAPGMSTTAGNVLALAGAVAIALYVLVLRGQRGDVLLTSAGVTTTAALVLLPLCLVSGAPLLPASSTQALWLLALALGPQVIGHTALNAALQRLPASVVSGSILGEPVIASALAWLALGEKPGALTAVGAGVTLIGVALLLGTPTSTTAPAEDDGLVGAGDGGPAADAGVDVSRPGRRNGTS
jgi:drug/metabolite transporter (DMT)-like permease